MERALDHGGAVLAWTDDHAVAAVRFQAAVDHLAVERLAVIPTARGQGIARALLGISKTSRANPISLRCAWGCGYRYPERQFYHRLGYRVCRLDPYPEGTDTWAVLAKPVEGVSPDRPG